MKKPTRMISIPPRYGHGIRAVGWVSIDSDIGKLQSDSRAVTKPRSRLERNQIVAMNRVARDRFKGARQFGGPCTRKDRSAPNSTATRVRNGAKAATSAIALRLPTPPPRCRVEP